MNCCNHINQDDSHGILGKVGKSGKVGNSSANSLPNLPFLPLLPELKEIGLCDILFGYLHANDKDDETVVADATAPKGHKRNNGAKAT